MDAMINRIPTTDHTAKITTEPIESKKSTVSSRDFQPVEIRSEKSKEISNEEFIKAMDRAIKSFQGSYTELNFSVHEQTKQIMVKVVDKETKEVIREIPPEKNLDLLAKLWEMAGILVDERR